MGDFLHGDAIEAALADVKIAAQQAQVTLAAANELIANINDLVLDLKFVVDAITQAKQP